MKFKIISSFSFFLSFIFKKNFMFQVKNDTLQEKSILITKNMQTTERAVQTK